MTTALTLGAAPGRRRDVVAVTLDGEVVVYAPDGTLHKLDPVATVLWEQFDGQVTLGALVEDLAEVYPDAGADVIARDVLSYAQQLLADGLVDV